MNLFYFLGATPGATWMGEDAFLVFPTECVYGVDLFPNPRLFGLLSFPPNEKDVAKVEILLQTVRLYNAPFRACSYLIEPQLW